MRMNCLNNTKCYVIFFIFGLFIQCHQKEKTPLTVEKLTDVLYDIHLAESAVEGESGDMKDSLTRLYYPQIFDKHGVKQMDFDTSMSKLSKDAIMMEQVYKSVIAKFKQKNDSITNPNKGR
jgi:Domain of unknown function (DUF4296)